jgi:DNA-binding NtrC family response regulator
MLDHQARQQQAARVAALGAERGAFPGHQRCRRGVVERAGGQPAALFLLGIGRHRLDETLDPIERGA